MIEPDTFCSDLVFPIPNASLYHFRILHYRFHNAWMRRVAGRLKSDYRYSGGVVYNNFVWPDLSGLDGESKCRAVETAAQAVLDARAQYPDSTISEMYDPDNDFLFPALTAAHRALDAAVESAYGVDLKGNDQEMIDNTFTEHNSQRGAEARA